MQRFTPAHRDHADDNALMKYPGVLALCCIVVVYLLCKKGSYETESWKEDHPWIMVILYLTLPGILYIVTTGSFR